MSMTEFRLGNRDWKLSLEFLKWEVFDVFDFDRGLRL